MEAKVNMQALLGRFAHSSDIFIIFFVMTPYMMPKNKYFLLPIAISALLICLLISCRLQGKLELVYQFDSMVPEASGLTTDGVYLFIVSDKNGDIYKLDLQGQLVDRLKTKTKDVEGITLRDTVFYLADEKKQKVYTYDLEGNRLANKKIEHPKIYDPANGLEGITFDTYTNQLLVLHEKNSGQIIRYDGDLNFIKQTFLGSFPDYSGIDTTKDHIWVISDEASGLAQYDRDMNLLKMYKIGIDSPEGIAIDENAGLIYIVSDTTGELVVFKLPELNSKS